MRSPSVTDDAKVPAEGWTWLRNSRKWHYFERKTGRSLCGGYLLFSVPEDLEADTGPSKEDCAGCRRALDRRNQRADGSCAPAK